MVLIVPKISLQNIGPHGELVGVTPDRGFAELGKQTGVEPILAALGKLKDVLGSNLTELVGLSGTCVSFLLELELGGPKAIYPVFEFLGRA
jgi:hypothetical protein